MERPPWSRASGNREFLRTYKACISCRQRKAKCELGGNRERGIPPGPPCLRCRREQRNCLFSEDRAWSRKKKTNNVISTTSGEQQPSLTGSPQIPGVPASAAGTPGSASLHSSAITDAETPASTSTHPSNAAAPLPMQYEPTGAASTPANMSTSSTSPLTSTMAPRPDPASDPGASSGLASSVMRTVVSSGNDALNILFQAAAQEQGASIGDMSTNSRAAALGQTAQPMQQTHGTPGSTTSLGMATTVSDPAHLSPAEPEVVAVWDSCRFVKMGWFSSREAVTYIDLFFKNMAPLSPILSNFYSHHRNHYWLITQEPVLCCTILMISSRYHTLPGVGGASRGFFIHQRLWQHCQHLIMRVMLGQEKGSKAKTRTVGTIEALLLMSEWHPRSLHFPPESDGWDSDLMMTSPDHITSAISPDMSVSAPNRWLEDVIEPARRSDRMSWMLLGSGLTLAHELGIFDADDSRARSMISSPEMESQGVDINLRRCRIQQLLYVFINQLASRLGCMSLMPQSLNHAVLAPFSQPALQMGDEWHSFMNSWIELTKLSKSVTDMFFPSASLTRQQFHSGRYIGLLDHFRPLLSQWRQKHLDTRHLSPPFRDMIFIEYQFTRVYTNSIGMQAVVERLLAESDPDSALDEVRQTNVDDIDYEFIQEVIDGSCHILQKVITLAETGALRFSPVRIFLRVTSSSIFLLKALSLGVRNAKLQESLEILTRSIQALRSSSLDDIHLGSRYATLLESLITRLRRSFVLSNKRTSRGTTRPSSVRPPADLHSSAGQPDVGHMTGNGGGQMEISNPVFDDQILSLNDINADDWLSLPFDPSMAPFGDGGNQLWSGFEGSNLNFIWNLPS
ncbi:Fungal Zn binuclear cluster domain containing protein [Coccidioides posadasii C735 delta SOWgp]|uniref:C6 transcription factor n=2 Tax=Coccidioides posadasii TaxID=199306 RepID=E9CXX7_COCPS|nr:Fungal Zn binuclear cluster domain containing protein [Coccidioides posadasii C735 delta SOWgp]EER26711.1 Fungal Zn binuclear cluster domain containing protein [Coccidioides posadasii C735 delta SOWgp]EFW20804.1 C6 transcription factor [Coccidioides posadasii str. Silveira]|eukprot:XP_003068856.1 Fungal Zn binuclear cluster domain containing protein [Coccidioides posadasii C735 delta SOWgp]